MNRTGRISIVLFLLGVLLIGIAFTRVYGAKIWFQMGGLAWVAAYFSVVLDNLIRKMPIQTRGGSVRYEEGSFRYFLPYLLMFVFGALFLTVILISLIIA